MLVNYFLYSIWFICCVITKSISIYVLFKFQVSAGFVLIHVSKQNGSLFNLILICCKTLQRPIPNKLKIVLKTWNVRIRLKLLLHK